VEGHPPREHRNAERLTTPLRYDLIEAFPFLVTKLSPYSER
jgi:hypothetical protein